MAAEVCSTCFTAAVEHAQCRGCGSGQAEPGRDRRALPVGAVVGGRFLVGKVLGAGGFGITYLAQDLRLRRRVALKEFFPSGMVSRTGEDFTVQCHADTDEPLFLRALERFLNEGQFLAKFDHPNIVKVLDLLQAHGTAYMAMEYHEGRTLRALLDEGGPLPEPHALQVLGFVCDALRNTHRAQVVHRDVKPDNVYLAQQGRTLLLDFGGAKQLSANTERSKDALFSNGYAAPEQYHGEAGQAGPWTDVYGCAATLFKVLTGRTPPYALGRFSHDEPLDWSDVEVSPVVRGVVAKAMRLPPGERFQSIEEFQAALAAAEPPAEEPPAAPTPAPAAAAARARRGPALAAAAVALALLGGAGLWLKDRHDRADLQDRVRRAIALEDLRDQLRQFHQRNGRWALSFEELGHKPPEPDAELRRVSMANGDIDVELAGPGLEGGRLQLRPTKLENGRVELGCWVLSLPEKAVPADLCRLP